MQLNRSSPPLAAGEAEFAPAQSNGLPVAIIELKNAGDERATVMTAHAQVQTYVREFPMAFRACVLTMVSDGVVARYGNPFTPLNHYAAWNVDDEGHVLPADHPALDSLFDGVANPERFLQIMRNFTSFAVGEDGITKRTAKPHQYFAVTKAVASTIQAVESDGKAGVVWHTQGSGKSLEMEFYSNMLSRHPRMLNPTIVVVTDRTELGRASLRRVRGLDVVPGEAAADPHPGRAAPGALRTQHRRHPVHNTPEVRPERGRTRLRGRGPLSSRTAKTSW